MITEATKRLRELSAWVLIGVAAVQVVAIVLALFAEGDFVDKAVSLLNTPVAHPATMLLMAGLLAAAVVGTTHLGTITPNARTITVVAVVEYGVLAMFGVIFLFAILAAEGVGLLAEGTIRVGFFLIQLGAIAVLAVGAALSVRTVQALPPRPQMMSPYGWGASAQATYPGPYGQVPTPGPVPYPGQSGQVGAGYTPYAQPGDYGQAYAAPVASPPGFEQPTYAEYGQPYAPAPPGFEQPSQPADQYADYAQADQQPTGAEPYGQHQAYEPSQPAPQEYGAGQTYGDYGQYGYQQPDTGAGEPETEADSLESPAQEAANGSEEQDEQPGWWSQPPR